MDNKAMKGKSNSLSPSNFIPNRMLDLDQNSNEDSITSGSLSPLRGDEKVQSRYRGPHLASCHDHCKYGKKHDTEAQRLKFRKFMKKKLAQEAGKNQATKPKATSKVETEFLDTAEVLKPQTLLSMKNSIAYGEKLKLEASEETEQSRISRINSDDKKSEVPNTSRNTTKTTVKKPISPVVPKVIQQKEPTSIIEPPRIKQMDSLPPKRTDPAPKPAITLKTRVPLLRSLSKRKSSRSQILRRNQESKIMRNPGSLKSGERELDDKTTESPVKSRIGEAKLLNPAPASCSSKTPHDTSSGFQLRKHRSIKRTLTSRDNVSGLQLRKVRSIKRTSTLHDNVSGLQLRKLRSVKRTSTLHDNVSSLQLRELRSIKRTSTQSESVPNLRLKKLRSIKRTATPDGNASSLQLRKLKSIKRTFTPHESVQSLQLKKLKSMKRNSTPIESISSLQLKKIGSIKRASMPYDNASNSQLRKLKSIKRTSKPHETAPSLQLKKLRSIKRTSISHESIPSLQLRKLGSIERALTTPYESVPSMQLKKLRSIRRASTPHESVSSSQSTKLSNVKHNSTPHDRILSYLPRKLRSMKRSLSAKDKDKVEKTNAESKSRNIDFDRNAKIEESICAVSDDKKRMRRIASIGAEDDTSAPVKLKFRRGKVINLRSDSKVARNLWLNIGKLAGENPIGTGLLRRRSSRRRRENASFDSKTLNPEVQSIVLKHQDVVEKADAKSLFNDVIEETASKLVKTRKSKVKALVGAFESVISLLESKPASVVRV